MKGVGLIKRGVYSLVAVVGVLLLAIVLFLLLVDPNAFRDDIRTIARQRAGVELVLAGDLSWRLFPVLGFGAEQVELALTPEMPTLVQIDSVTLGVEVLPLLQRRIAIDALEIDGLHANLEVAEDGTRNWEATATTPTEAASTAAGEEETAPLPELTIPRLRVRDARIDYRDKTAAEAYTVALPLLELRDVNFAEPFPMQLQARVSDGGELGIAVRLQGQVSATVGETYALRALALTATVEGLAPKPLTVKVSGDVDYDQSRDRLEVALSRLQVSDLVASGNLVATELLGTMAFEGRLATRPFDARALSESLGVALPAGRDPATLTAVQLTASLAGSPQKAAIDPLTLRLDDSTLTGSVAVTDLSRMATRFDLQLDRIKAGRYLPPEAAGAGSPPADSPPAGQAPAELIPVEALRSLDLSGRFQAGEVVLETIPLRNIGVQVSAREGRARLTDLAAQALGGTLTGEIVLDARQSEPTIASQLQVDSIALGELLRPFTPAEILSGRSSLSLDVATRGNDIDPLIRQALGQLDLSASDLVLHGVNLNQLVVDAINRKVGNFGTLLAGYRDKLPKELEEDTRIHDMLAKMRLDNGKLILPDMDTETGAGRLTAAGSFDLLNRGFDYRFGVQLAALNDHRYLSETRWPVRCRGDLDTPVSRWCRIDAGAMNATLEQAAKQALRDKAAEKVGEELGLEDADEAAAREALRQKAREEEERAKRKLREKLDEKLKDLF